MKTLSIITLSIMLLISCTQSTANKTANNNKLVVANKNIPTLKSDTTFEFNNYPSGRIPKGWSQFVTGRGNTTDWKIIEDNDINVLAQLSDDNPNYHFNVVVFDGFIIKNTELSVKMKGVNGRMDQGGGFVWRFFDKDNYYVVRANPLEDNVVLYKVENGKRTDLPLIGKGRTYGTDVEKLGNDWNELKLKVANNLFTVYLNNKQIFQVADDTFTEAGKIGLWTKADAVTYFNEYSIKVSR